ncbi:MAG: hypothetical protein AAF922_10595 [Pseudomonadota bacterium]
MRLDRLGSAHATRLSFMRQLLRRMRDEAWEVTRAKLDIDAQGVGTALYSAVGPDRAYTLVAFAHDLPDDQRSDRVIATAWDATFTLYDGVPGESEIARLRANVPHQEAGRVSGRELTLSRANKSMRLWDHVVGALASGRQPEPERVDAVGYLMRTTAVYGSGKFGAADHAAVAHRPECAAPFQLEMLTVYLIRCFVMDLVEHMARARAPDKAVPLDPALRRRLGIGNSTGLGMAPFLINHPDLLNAWIGAREGALARIRSLNDTVPSKRVELTRLVARAIQNAQNWQSGHAVQKAKLADLRDDLIRLSQHLRKADLQNNRPWNRLWLWSESALTNEGQEQLLALMLELYPELVHDLCAFMAANESTTFAIDGAMSRAKLLDILRETYGWALTTDWTAPEAQEKIWYVSEAKQEPRLGLRNDEDLIDYEQPLGIGQAAAQLFEALTESAHETAAGFLLTHPEHRHMIRRAQRAAHMPYAEIHDNTLGHTLRPMDMLRLKLSFFGATHFDPRSDRWVRITMFRDAPFPEDLQSEAADDWTLPPLPIAAQ